MTSQPAGSSEEHDIIPITIPTGSEGLAVSSDITGWLKAWSNGDAQALDHLTPLVYDELRRLARRHMRREGSGQTLQTTALAHEAFIRLVKGKGVRWQDRAHFFAVAAQAMRRIPWKGRNHGFYFARVARCDRVFWSHWESEAKLEIPG